MVVTVGGFWGSRVPGVGQSFGCWHSGHNASGCTAPPRSLLKIAEALFMEGIAPKAEQKGIEQ